LPPREEVIVPYPPTLASEPEATHCRSTLLAASMSSLRAHGHFDRYASALSEHHVAAITGSIAGVWLPIDVGVAHYRACDALGLPDDERLAMGGEVVRALQRTFIGTAVKAASQGIGFGPIVGLQKFTSVYGRTIKGGGARVVKIGPKDARVEFVGLPLASVSYFRVAYRGFIQAGCELFARRVVVAELAAYLSPTTLAYRIAWV
jgi:hypothetical protein